MKFKFCITFFLLFILVKQSFGESSIDSLRLIVVKHKKDTTQIKSLIALSELIYLTSPDSTIRYMEEAKELSEALNFKIGIASTYGWLAYLYEQQGSATKALEYYNKSLKLYRSLKNKTQEATCLNNIAAIYNNQGKINDALIFNFKSLAIKRQIHDTDGISTSYNNIGLILSSQGKIPQALNYFSRALKNYELRNDSNGIATAVQNIAFVYKAQHEYNEAFIYFKRGLEVNLKINDKYGLGYSYNALGGIYEEVNKLDSALYYYNQAFNIRKEIADKQGIFYTLKNIAAIHFKMGNWSMAKEEFEKCLAGFNELGDKWGLCIVYNKLGELQLKSDLANAEKLVTTSLKLAKELGYPSEIKNAAANLQRIYRQRGDWKNALLMNDLFISMRDSVVNDENRKIAIRTQFKYEFEKREASIKSEQEKRDVITKAEIKKQLIIRNSISAGLIALMIFFIVVYRQRNKISIEKKRSDTLLLNILPEEVADELKLKGYAAAKQFDKVTVMFTDFKGFTMISEKLSPAELVEEIDTCFKAFDAIITKYNIEKIKTIGDSYMCAGGLPIVTTTNALDVVNAALEIKEFMIQYFQQRKLQSKDTFEIRIGVHTGPVVAGIVGIKKFAYDIWGDTVNIASRMESSGEVGKVNISQTTYEEVKNYFACNHRGKIQAKNKGEIDMYFVEGVL